VLQNIVLGIVQGLTEFLPVSSSGHLVVVPALLGWDDPSLTFDLLLHVATLLAVVVALRRELWTLVQGVLGRGTDPAAARRLVGYLAVGSIPAVIVGALLANTFEDLFQKPGWVCGFWVVTGFILLGAERLLLRAALTGEREVGARSSLLIGSAQALAITPGISRSGSTIAAGMTLGLPRAEAARFSFLLSIPIILGAALTRVSDITSGDFHLTAAVWAGVLVAAVSGYLAVEGLLRYVKTNSLRVFAVYLFVAAPVSAIVLALK